jgi:hypothetical protein
MRKSYIDAIEQQVRTQGVMDSNETAFFIRELEQIEARTYDIRYPDIKFRSLVSMQGGLSPAAEYNTWRQWDKTGSAEEVEMSTDDIPQVEIAGAEFQSKVIDIATSYSYTTQDIRAAQYVGRPLDAMKAAAARELVERKLDKVAAAGSKYVAQNSVYGLLNAPGVGYAVHNGSAVTPSASGGCYLQLRQAAAGSSNAQNAWAAGGKTPKEMVHDVTDAFNFVVTKTNDIFHPDTLVLDIASKVYVATTMINDADASIFLNDTVETYILRLCPWLKSIESWVQCSDAKLGSTGTALARSFLYEKKPENFGMMISQEFEQFAPQLKNFKFAIPCHARTAGVVTRYPMAGIYLDGLQP